MTVSSAEGSLLPLDPWRDWGLLGVPDPSQQESTNTAPSFRGFIETAYPGCGFRRWPEHLVAQLRALASRG